MLFALIRNSSSPHYSPERAATLYLKLGGGIFPKSSNGLLVGEKLRLNPSKEIFF